MSVFRFKQFSIQQDQCAMKIGTDGVLLGAWAAIAQASSILDIGTGTGLLALMAAQRNPTAQITAVEIDAAAANQAKQNIQQSPWQERIKIHCTNVSDFQSAQGFDVIISNPPYFEAKKSTQIQQQARALARSTIKLSFEALIQAVLQHLTTQGQFFCILPTQEGIHFCKIAQKAGLYLCKCTAVRPRVGQAANRLLLGLERQPKPIQYNSLSIRLADKQNKQYSPEFAALHRHFLLVF